MKLDKDGRILARWFISYWPYNCGEPACMIWEGKSIEKKIKQISENGTDDGIQGTVIFFAELPAK